MVDLLGGNLSRGVAQTVSSRERACRLRAISRRSWLWAIFTPRAVRRRFSSLSSKARPSWASQGLQLLGARAYLGLQRLVPGIGDEAILGLGVGSVLHDLFNGVVLGEELEAVSCRQRSRKQ